MVLPFAIPYPEVPEVGYWGNPTSTIDWCEENYVISHYIAEIVNTVTNGAFILLAGFALFNGIKQRLELRFHLVALGFITVGFGSWMFHMSLLYEYQLLDELPMIYATCVPYWIVFSYGKTKFRSMRIATEITLFAIVLTVVYLYDRNPSIHQTAYGILTGIVMLKTFFLTKKHVTDQTIKKRMDSLLLWGLIYIVIGYFLWNMDIHFCTSWRWLRRSIGLPYGFVLEGHGWWHLLTGIGVYHYIIYLQYLRIFLLNKQTQYELVWSFRLIPHLDLKKEFKDL